jgi:hypothetical protein
VGGTTKKRPLKIYTSNEKRRATDEKQRFFDGILMVERVFLTYKIFLGKQIKNLCFCGTAAMP